MLMSTKDQNNVIFLNISTRLYILIVIYVKVMISISIVLGGGRKVEEDCSGIWVDKE